MSGLPGTEMKTDEFIGRQQTLKRGIVGAAVKMKGLMEENNLHALQRP